MGSLEKLTRKLTSPLGKCSRLSSCFSFAKLCTSNHFLGVFKCFIEAKVFMNRLSHPTSLAENQRPHNLIHPSIQSRNQYISCTAGSAETLCRYKVSQKAETCIWHLDMGEIIESGSKPQEVEPVPGVMHLSAVGSPPSLTFPRPDSGRSK